MNKVENQKLFGHVYRYTNTTLSVIEAKFDKSGRME